MFGMMAQVRRRVVAKSRDPHAVPQDALAEPPRLDAETAQAKKQVYLVTFPHPIAAAGQNGAPLVAPGTLTHQQLMEKILAACAAPSQANAPSSRKAMAMRAC